MSYYILVVDTEQYSGNFEREIGAYLTGQVGECGVGQEFVSKYSQEIKNLKWWEKNIYQKADEDGCYRPVEIYPTEGWLNNGMGTCFKKTDQDDKGYPAYLSVAVFMNEKPTEEVIDEFIQRAKNFCINIKELSDNADFIYKTALTFTGVRLLKCEQKNELIGRF